MTNEHKGGFGSELTFLVDHTTHNKQVSMVLVFFAICSIAVHVCVAIVAANLAIVCV